jgi:hypothetical protein
MAHVLEDQLVCPRCGRIEELPTCHGKPMELDGRVFFCPTCAKEVEVPVCCHAPMKLRRKVRDIRKEIFGVL